MLCSINMFAFILLALVNFVLAVPAGRSLAIHLTNSTTGDCDALIEETPWQINDLVMFKANPGPHSVSYLVFDFIDTNQGLEMKTQCQHYLSIGSNDTVTNNKWTGCVSHDVLFKFDGQILELERWYQDPCLGGAPHDSAIAHGRANITLLKTPAADGLLSTQTEMHIPITSLS